jgi:hypothetical protein
VTCGVWSWRRDSNPEPAVYKTAANRPPGTSEYCPCSSGQVGRPASTLLWGRVVPGGMTSGMTCDGGVADRGVPQRGLTLVQRH